MCDFALIGGSSTLSINLPEELGLDYVEIKEESLFFPTPFGRSPSFQHLVVKTETGDKQVLTCRMHGWRTGVSRANASRQVFWVLRHAGVRKILAEGGVGAVNHLLKPRDMVVPHDYIDFSMRKDVGLDDRYLLMMRDAMCPSMRNLLFQVAQETSSARIFERSVYVNTDGRHFESPAEINLCKLAGADVVGQSLCPEIYLAREIGACYAGIYLVVNYAEGIVSPWQHQELTDIFYSEGHTLGRLLFETLRRLPIESDCQCASLRQETLLKDAYKEEDDGEQV
jgi:5'-methylthioadenosine phosphorylase